MKRTRWSETVKDAICELYTNGDSCKRDDNTPENLMLMGKKEHMSMHMKERHEKERKIKNV